MKIKLQKSKPYPYLPQRACVKSVKLALPFFKSRRGEYFHRVRSADNHWWDGKYSHTSVSFWCGNTGSVGKKGNLYGKVPEGGILCAVCEGKAIGAGEDGARVINGKDVMYSPRK